ncbi:hypothetical protein BDF20DRAFT_879747 [Mycotypha africana]|uniref:uncharacterized protein n=1 Tax=Mycotypha africana TaxID=64632 RepID=UPI002300D064|nr:uncharacterized protein BDF20DRAFT_879747 [Mycotypha africana]KAI8975627.1 hypothetical protein BDF20DRAFT_879747 [Mycotypha africana]
MSNSSATIANVAQHVQYISTLDVALPFIQRSGDRVTASVTEIIKAVLNAYTYRKALGEENANSVTWLQGYIVCVILGSGGASTVSLLRGEALSILYKDDFWIINGLAYCSIFSNRYIFQVLQLLFQRFTVLHHICQFIVDVSRGYAIVRLGVDGGSKLTKSAIMLRESVVGQIVCGTLIGCASGLWVELLGLLQPTWTFSMPKSFLALSYTVKISMMTTLLYLLLLKPFYSEDLSVAHTISALTFAALLLYFKLKSDSNTQKPIGRIDIPSEKAKELAKLKKRK